MSCSTDLTASQLQELLDDLMDRETIKQAIMAVESGDQSFRWVGTKGSVCSGGEPVSEETPFFIASIDKLYNATIIMMLSETGKLNIDSPITEYLPNALTQGLNRFGGIDYSENITVRHLLSHTSGIADWLEDYPKDASPLIEQILKEGDRSVTIEELVTFVREQLEPHFPPQNLSEKRPKVRYSDTNYMLIIAIIEAVTRQPLHQVHEQFLYKPLNLRHTYFPGFSRTMDPTPEPIVLHAKGQPLHIPLLMCSIRGIYSTVTDTLNFLRRFVRDEVFQSPETLASMQNSWHQFGFPFDRAALRSPGWPVEYGLGIMRFRLPCILTPTWSMPTVLGHTGSTGCWLFYCPQWDLLLCGSVDEVTAGAVPYKTLPKILHILRSSKWRKHNDSVD